MLVNKIVMSGHETFPLRVLWLPKLKKLNEFFKGKESSLEEKMVFCGVGKNMISSMSWWGQTIGFFENHQRELSTSEIGGLILGSDRQDGLDEFCEHISTSWLVHWQLASTPDRAYTYYHLFNCINQSSFDREFLLRDLTAVVQAHNLKISSNTIRRDIECCLRSYVPRLSGKGYEEDFLEPLLAELDLLKIKSRDVVEFCRSSHQTLSDSLFAYALVDYWERMGMGATLDVMRITYDFGSPGRVFKLDRHSVMKRLQNMKECTSGFMELTDQASLRQMIRKNVSEEKLHQIKMNLLKDAY